MQCPSCQFENMPGSRHCARCGAMVTLAGQSIDVNPPRASRYEVRLPGRLAFMVRRFREQLGQAVSGLLGVHDTPHDFEGGLTSWLALLVPGLHQWRRGDPSGSLWLMAWVALLSGAVVFAGLLLGSVALGLAFAVHIASVTDVLARQFHAFSDRIRFALLTALILACVYYPLIRWIGEVATPVRVMQGTSVFESGDVAWYRPHGRPSLGELVLYEPTPTTYAARYNNLNAQIQIRGLRINRLIANPAQTVRWQSRQLYVNGQLSNWQPNDSMQVFPDFELVVPAGHAFVLPEDLVVEAGARLNPNLVSSLGLVPTSSIRGPIILRSYPFSRLEIFRN